MSHKFQGVLIENALMDAMDKHPEKIKHEIISMVAEQGFPRPSIRRIKGDLLKKLVKHAEILKLTEYAETLKE